MPAPACGHSIRSEPVLRHAKTYNGNDADVTEALSTYVYFRDDARFNGWKSYLQRSDDFIRFCCHMHIANCSRLGAEPAKREWCGDGLTVR